MKSIYNKVVTKWYQRVVIEFSVYSFLFPPIFGRRLIRGVNRGIGLEALGNLGVRIERLERLVKITQFSMANMNRVLALQNSRSFLAFNKTVHCFWKIATSSHEFYLFFNIYVLNFCFWFCQWRFAAWYNRFVVQLCFTKEPKICKYLVCREEISDSRGT